MLVSNAPVYRGDQSSQLAGEVDGFDILKMNGISIQMPNVNSRTAQETSEAALGEWSTMNLGVGGVLEFRLVLASRN